MKSDSKLQIFTTVLAYTLPVLQLLFGLLSSGQKQIFLFRDYFIFISVAVAIVSYVLILTLKIKPYFSYTPFQRNRKRAWREWNQKTNRYVDNYSAEEVKNYIQNNIEPAPLFVLNPENITVRLLIPTIVASVIAFTGLGVLTQSFQNDNPSLTAILGLVQAVMYLTIISASVVAFSIYYYYNRGIAEYNMSQATTFDRALELARKENAFDELKAASLIAQKQITSAAFGQTMVFMVRVGDQIYIHATNEEITKTILALGYNTLQEALDFYESID